MGGQCRQRCRIRCRPSCQSVHQRPRVLSGQNARARGRFDRRKAHTSRKKGRKEFPPPVGPSARRTDGRRGDCARSCSIAGRDGARPIVANPSTASSSRSAYTRSISRDISTAGACDARLCVELSPQGGFRERLHHTLRAPQSVVCVARSLCFRRRTGARAVRRFARRRVGR